MRQHITKVNQFSLFGFQCNVLAERFIFGRRMPAIGARWARSTTERAKWSASHARDIIPRAKSVQNRLTSALVSE